MDKSGISWKVEDSVLLLVKIKLVLMAGISKMGGTLVMIAVNFHLP